MSEKKPKQTERVNIPLFVLLLSRRDDGREKEENREVGFSLIWEIHKTLFYIWDFRFMETT